MDLLFVSAVKQVLIFPYYLFSSVIATAFFIIFSILDQRLFYTPYLIFYIPKEGTLDLILSCIASVLIGLVLSLTAHHIRDTMSIQGRKQCNLTLPALPAAISVLSSTCLGCSVYMSAFITSLFGAMGVGIISFLTFYNLPIRFISLTFLVYSLYFLNKSIKNNKDCLKKPMISETTSLK